jgi:predicted ATPase
MLSQIHLQGFKCFVDQSLDLRALTLLSGLNSSGKSSVIQALRLLHRKKPLPDYGPLDDLISVHAQEFSLKVQGGNLEIALTYTQHQDLVSIGDFECIPNYFSFISAARLGPESSLPLTLDYELLDVGEKGEFVLDLLSRYEELKGIPDPLRHNLARGGSVRLNVRSWLNEITPGVEFEPYFDRKADRGRAEYSTRRPTNVGFGLSYTMPVIANVLVYAALIASGKTDKALILIENPEAHLHPAGQTKMGEFLTRAAACGVQCIVETHSDHLLNGMRIAVKDGLLPARDTACYLFSYDFDQEKAEVKCPLLDDQGMFDEWPEGFFDEAEKNLDRLL